MTIDGGTVDPPGDECSQGVLSNNLQNGSTFGGANNQRLAIDILVDEDTTFTLNEVEPTVLTAPGTLATSFNFIFYSDASGYPGTVIETVGGTITASNLTGTAFGFDFVRYTVELDTPVVMTEGVYWMEIETDALYWESTTASVLGSSMAYFHAGTAGVWRHPEENTGGVPTDLVYELIGTCEVTVDPPGDECSQGVLSNNLQNGSTFGGANNQRLAIDILVDEDTTFTLNEVEPTVLTAPGTLATSFNFIFYSDASGYPGTVIETVGGTITASNLTGTAFGFDFVRYTVELDTPVVMTEGVYWMEIETDALYWESTTASVLGSSMAYFHAGTAGVWRHPEENTGGVPTDLVYELIGTCEVTVDPPADGCLNVNPDLTNEGQYPSATFTPSCSGAPEAVTTLAWTGEFSKVAVTAGTQYVFSSSINTDFVTIGNEDGTVVLAAGLASVTWTAPSDQVVRFYLHLSDECDWAASGLRSRIVQCGDIPPPPVNDDCANAIALSCGDTVSGSTISAGNSGGNDAGDVFYTYTGTGAEETITVSLCGSGYDTFIRVFSDCTLTNEIEFNDDFCGLQSEVEFYSDGTSTYVIMVEGYSTNVGNYTLNLSCEPYEPPTGYCEPELDCTDGDLITNVTFAGINNTTSCSPNGYGDYTEQIAEVEAGSTNEISVTVGDGWAFESVSVWIDYNNNFIFEENEFTYIGTGSAGDVVGNIVIPEGTPDGLYRMRVRVAAVGELGATWDMSCDEDQFFGETEDYTVNVGELGISDMNSFDFTYYPNPVKDILNIDAKQSIENVSVYNLAGQQVMSKVNVSNGKVDVKSLSPGAYVFRVTLEGGQVETFKVIKK